MKNMRLKYDSLAMLCLLLLALLPASCIKDEYAAKGTATVTMTFTTRTISNPTTRAVGELLDNEQMRTLRVIVARSSNSEILYNLKYAIQPQETQKTITFSELTVKKDGEDFDFYAIANEDAFVTTETELEGKGVDLAALKTRVLAKSFNRPTPLAIIPQAGFQTIHVEASENQEASMQLQFPVGKVQLIFNNQTGSEVTLTNVGLMGVAPNQGYLFKGQGLNEGVPLGTSQVGNLLFGNEGTLTIPVSPLSDVSPFVRYIYPGQKNAGDYKLTAYWNGKQHEVVLKLKDAAEAISSIGYGEQYNINITLLANSLRVTLNVLPWTVDGTEIDFSTEFNAILLPAAAGSLKLVDPTSSDAAIAVATNTDDTERNATFSFKMVSPVGARWTAHLESTTDFRLEGTSSGYGAADAEPSVFSVTPIHEFDAQNPQSVKLFITVDTSFGGSDDEGIQIINPETNGVRKFPGNDTEITIRQVGESAFDQLTESVAIN